MQGLKESIKPRHRQLTEEEVDRACDELVHEFPRVIRSAIDTPIPTQKIGLVTFIYYDEPKTLSNGNKVYGHFKLRGVYSDENQAEAAAADIIRKQDSRHRIGMFHVGHFFPLTNDTTAFKKTTEINTNISEEAEREYRDNVKKEEERTAQKVKELKEREEEVKNARDLNDDPESIEYYTMKRVSFMMFNERLEKDRKRLKDDDEKLLNYRKHLEELDKKHPLFKDEWVDVYNTERKKSGIPPYIPSKKENEGYDNFLVGENKSSNSTSNTSPQ